MLHVVGIERSRTDSRILAMIAAISTACGQAVAPPVDGSRDVAARDIDSDAMSIDSSICPAFDGGFTREGAACSFIGDWESSGHPGRACHLSIAANGSWRRWCDFAAPASMGQWSACGNVLSMAVAGGPFSPDGCAEVEEIVILPSYICLFMVENELSSTCYSRPDVLESGMRLWFRAPDRDH